MKLSCFFLILTLSLFFNCYAQQDSGKTQDIKNSIRPPINRKLYISGGVGLSTILYRIYYVYDQPEYAAHGTSQSLVQNGTIDYRINRISFGAGIAYQTATGVPYTGSSTQTEFTESLTRLNISGRILWYPYYTNKIELYTGLRVGESYWTDIITPLSPPLYWVKLALGNTYTHYTSLQIPFGIRYLIDHFGFHLEAAIGTPYFIEGGLTLKIGKQ